MTGASKILTVSYGTFSCTLEGFDDPFNTMKAIAEYFRDLAAEDRYFGAEPPTPDAAMLHKIAEREIQRRVEAKIQDNGVILRAQEGVTPKVSFPSPAAAEPVVVVAPLPVLSTAAEAAPAVESAAARLSRLRAAQSHAAPTVAATLTAPLEMPAQTYLDAYPEDAEAAVADLPAEPVSKTLRAVPDQAPESVVAAQPKSKSVAKSEDRSADKPADKTPVKSQAELDRAAAREARKAKKAKTDAAAAKPQVAARTEDVLANIARSMTAPETSVEAAPPVTTETAPAALAAPRLADSLAAAIRETLAGIGDADDQLAADIASAAEPVAPETAIFTADDQDYLPETMELETTDAETTVLLDTVEAAPLGATVSDHDADAGFAPDIAAPDAVEDEAPEVEPEAADLVAVPEPADLMQVADLPHDTAADETAQAAQPAQTETAAAAETAAPPASDKIQRARARVIKVRRTEAVPEIAAPVATPARIAAPQVTALTAQDEADLQNELASLEAELASAPAAAPTGSALTEANRLVAAETDDASVNRLLQKANSELEVPETKRRRSAIAHLKAAVLATVAERRTNPNANAPDTQRMDTYRKDLDKVMRPAPSDRPAPLVLVSSQRIDRKPDGTLRPQVQAAPVQPAQQIQPVRPRRVSVGRQASQTATAADFGDDFSDDAVSNIFTDPSRQTFAEFAESLGATSMHDMIEAAGAYCTLVLGRESFTRPELFQQIASVRGETDLSREDGLRGFGRLLRDGRLTKTKRGEYTLAETSPILHEARRRAS